MNIKEEYHKWHSPSLDRNMEMLVFGHAGQPVILFPTSQGAYYQNKDQGMIEAAATLLEKGKVKSIVRIAWMIRPGTINRFRRKFGHTTIPATTTCWKRN